MPYARSMRAFAGVTLEDELWHTISFNKDIIVPISTRKPWGLCNAVIVANSMLVFCIDRWHHSSLLIHLDRSLS